MASGCIERWALLLSGYDYSIRCKPGKANANADALSCLPLPSSIHNTPIPAEIVHLTEHLATTPLSSFQIQRWTDQDLTLSKVKRWVQEGWPDKPDTDQEFAPYTQRTLELGVEGGCVLWVCRVVVPPRGRKRAFQMLHERIAQMKALARSYMWWPGMPYHPASNGLVERAVQTFKEGFKRLRQGSINTRISRFLFKYRLTPHSSTGLSPAKLMFGRKLRSQLDQIKPSLERQAHKSQDQQRKCHDKRSKTRSFTQDEQVYARNYGPGPKWLPGVVVKLEGSVLREVRLEDGRIVRRHVNQLRPHVGVGKESPQTDEGVDVPSQHEKEGGSDEIVAEPRNSDSEPLTSETTSSTELPPESSTQEEVSEPVSTGGLIHDRNGYQEPASESANAEGLSPSNNETGPKQSTVRRSGRVRKPPMRYEGQFP